MKYIRKDKFIWPNTPMDILKLALEKEKSSFEFYRELIKRGKNSILTNLLTELKNAEWGHVQKIQQKLER